MESCVLNLINHVVLIFLKKSYNEKNKLKFMKKIEAIDLFCWIWGLSCWLRQANIEVLAWLDFDESCKEIYETNNHARFYWADISKFDFSEFKKLYSKDSIKVLVGCAPCQPFSSHSNKYKRWESDTRWNLIDHFIRAVDELSPDIVSMENVRGLTKQKVFADFVQKLKDRNYEVNYEVVYCPEYGIPQARYRLVLIASKIWEIKVPQKTHTKEKFVTVWDVLKKLPDLRAWETYKNDIMHKSLNLTDINIQRIKQSKPKWTWKDWDEKLLPNCYRKQSWATYTAVYGRMSWDDVSPTITTQFFNYGSWRFWHPDQDRALSLREWAILQTFPQNYNFWEKIHITKVARQIGNAVPPKLGEVIWETIIRHIKNNV